MGRKGKATEVLVDEQCPQHTKSHSKMTVAAEDYIPLSDGKEKSAKRKEVKPKLKKKPRLIVRNLPFKSTEETVRKHFEAFGEIIDLNLLRRPDNKLVGCCFVEYKRAQSAAKAIAHASGRPFMGRTIVVDWAVAKDKYAQQTKGSDASDTVTEEVKKEEDDTSSESSEVQELDKPIKTKDEESSEEDEDDEQSDEKGKHSKDFDFEFEVLDSKKSVKPVKSEQDEKPRFQSNDVTEGRTVFLRNLPFSVDNDKLKEFGKQFGCVMYAVVCMDAASNHSRGTGFIKFKDAPSVENFIAQSKRGELLLENRSIDASPAISRDDANKAKSQEKVKNDNRNLYLLKEGLVTAGSSAAEGVSQSDMEKRIKLEQWKTKTLRDLTMFVSRIRLVIHNLPPTYNDEQLRALVLKHAGRKPRVTEARIMRNLRDRDANGVGRSKEFGFVTFTNHENALECLRNINNNPKIFGPKKRPIVSFSLEDRKMLNIRKRRQERSLMKNPTWKHYKKENEGESGKKKIEKRNEWKNGKKKSTDEKPGFDRKRKNSASTSGPESKVRKVDKPFMGAVAKQGEGGTIPLRKLRGQAETVRKNAREAKKKNVKKKQKEDRIRQPRQPIKAKENKDNFSEMVNKYKASLNVAGTARSKWFE